MSRHDLAMRVEKLSAVQQAWQELFDQASAVTPFMSYEWFAALAKNLLKTDPDVLLFYRRTGAVGIVPGSMIGNRLQMIGDKRVTDLVDMLCLPGELDHVLGFLGRYVSGKDLGMDLYPLDEHSPLVTGFVKQVPGSVVEQMDVCPLLSLASTWDEYLAGLGGKERHELRRKMKKVNGAHIQDVQPADTHRLYQLMSAAGNDKADFLNDETRNFFSEIVEAFDKRGWLRMREAVIDREVLGVLFAFAYDKRVYLFNMGHNIGMRKLSPGIVTVALDIRSAIDEKYEYYDFLRGDEEYKYRLGAVKRHTMRVKR